MMTSLRMKNVSWGDMAQVLGVLEAAGLDANLWLALKENTTLARVMVEAANAHLSQMECYGIKPSNDSYSTLWWGYFPSPKAQLSDLLDLDRRSRLWGFTNEEIDRCARDLRDLEQTPTEQIIVTPFHDSPQHTLERLAILLGVSPERTPEVCDNHPNPETELRAIRIRLENFPNKKDFLATVNDAGKHPSASVLAACVWFPRWVHKETMRAERLRPVFIWVPGFRGRDGKILRITIDRREGLSLELKDPSDFLTGDMVPLLVP